MKKSVYLETSVISYLTSRQSADVVVAARQVITRDWWEACRMDFELVASPAVMEEASQGSAEAVGRRLTALDEIPLLEIRSEAIEVAKALIDRKAVPPGEYGDALHIALASVHNIDYLLTWNFKHIANVATRSRIDSVVLDFGIQPAIICTPEELDGPQYGAPHD